ncbi:MAG: hypothetical protein ACI4QD_05835 [Kiritimatiellia bacterium]
MGGEFAKPDAGRSWSLSEGYFAECVSLQGAPIDEREGNVQARVADGDLCLEQTGWMRGLGG